MTTHDSGSDTGARRPAGQRPGVRLVERHKSCTYAYEQNRLQVRLRQLEQERRAALARVNEAQRRLKLHERLAAGHDRGTHDRPPGQPRVTTCVDDDETTAERHDDGEEDEKTSKCLCDCCRYGLYTGKTDKLQR